MATRPANDWLIASVKPKCWEPVSTNRPGSGSSSTASCKYEKSLGTR